ncbi:MAG: hypothetical protein ACM359_15940 [Bacillota bacterium]
MVSPQSNPNPTVGQSVTTGRGFVTPEEAQAGIYQPQPTLARSRISWGAVIAGSLLATSILVLSGSLAYACGVPAFAGGPYGWGAGIWSIITAAIAFYAGGCLSAYLAGGTNLAYSNMLHGVMAWVLAVPLIMVLFSGTHGMFSQGGLMASDVTRMVISGNPQATVNPMITAQSTVNPSPNLHLTGAAWGAWISLAVGLIFAAIGGSSVMGDRFMGNRFMGRGS